MVSLSQTCFIRVNGWYSRSSLYSSFLSRSLLSTFISRSVWLERREKRKSRSRWKRQRKRKHSLLLQRKNTVKRLRSLSVKESKLLVTKRSISLFFCYKYDCTRYLWWAMGCGKAPSPVKIILQNKISVVHLHFHNNLEPCCDWLELCGKVDITLMLNYLQYHCVVVFLLPCTWARRSLGVSVQGMNRQ